MNTSETVRLESPWLYENISHSNKNFHALQILQTIYLCQNGSRYIIFSSSPAACNPPLTATRGRTLDQVKTGYLHLHEWTSHFSKGYCDVTCRVSFLWETLQTIMKMNISLTPNQKRCIILYQINWKWTGNFNIFMVIFFPSIIKSFKMHMVRLPALFYCIFSIV